jgi:DNA polymerase III epsilon subunit-like protein
MAQPNKPQLFLSLDVESSGSAFSNMKATTDLYQCLSIGAVVARLDDLSIVDSFYVEIKYDGVKYRWQKEAEAIHGLTQGYLMQNGVDMKQAAEMLGNFVFSHFGTSPIIFAGHNCEFDIAFINDQVMKSVDIQLDITHKRIDTSSMGLILFGIPRSNDLYEFLGLPPRNQHNALEDALCTVQALEAMRDIVEAGMQELVQ